MVAPNRQTAIDNRQSIITLLTDFGNQDYFVGAMKGVILSINPAARIVDITHEVPPQDIESAAFNLLACYCDFAPRTIHVAVVDPGVGSNRRALALKCSEYFFVGPDNGIFSWICEREGEYHAYSITAEQFLRQPVSSTFHGRDVFAPAAAALSAGNNIAELGDRVQEIVRLPSLKPDMPSEHTIEGRIIHIDRFGNCIANLRQDHWEGNRLDGNAKLTVNGQEIVAFHKYFADAPERQLFYYFGSAGFLEIAAKNLSAQKILDARRGQTVKLNLPART